MATAISMVAATATWPAERRELLAIVSRLATALVGMLSEPATQSGAISTLSALCQAAPHCLRPHRDKLGALLPAIAPDSEFCTSVPL